MKLMKKMKALLDCFRRVPEGALDKTVNLSCFSLFSFVNKSNVSHAGFGFNCEYEGMKL